MPDTNKQPSQEEMNLVIFRLEVQSPELHFSSGNNFHNFSRDEMINQIKDNTKVGKEFVATELKFLRALKDGSLLEALDTDDE